MKASKKSLGTIMCIEMDKEQHLINKFSLMGSTYFSSNYITSGVSHIDATCELLKSKVFARSITPDVWIQSYFSNSFSFSATGMILSLMKGK